MKFSGTLYKLSTSKPGACPPGEIDSESGISHFTVFVPPNNSAIDVKAGIKKGRIDIPFMRNGLLTFNYCGDMFRVLNAVDDPGGLSLYPVTSSDRRRCINIPDNTDSNKYHGEPCKVTPEDTKEFIPTFGTSVSGLAGRVLFPEQVVSSQKTTFVEEHVDNTHQDDQSHADYFRDHVNSEDLPMDSTFFVDDSFLKLVTRFGDQHRFLSLQNSYDCIKNIPTTIDFCVIQMKTANFETGDASMTSIIDKAFECTPPVWSPTSIGVMKDLVAFLGKNYVCDILTTNYPHVLDDNLTAYAIHPTQSKYCMHNSFNRESRVSDWVAINLIQEATFPLSRVVSTWENGLYPFDAVQVLSSTKLRSIQDLIYYLQACLRTSLHIKNQHGMVPFNFASTVDLISKAIQLLRGGQNPVNHLSERGFSIYRGIIQFLERPDVGAVQKVAVVVYDRTFRVAWIIHP